MINAFGLNMTAGTLSLGFTTRVDVSSINVTLLTLQSSMQRVGGTSVYRLTGGAVVASASFATGVVVQLTLTDLNNIKAISTLAVSQGSTFLVVDGNEVGSFLRVAFHALDACGAVRFVANHEVEFCKTEFLLSF